jgi:hypothetical protein
VGQVRILLLVTIIVEGWSRNSVRCICSGDGLLMRAHALAVRWRPRRHLSASRAGQCLQMCWLLDANCAGDQFVRRFERRAGQQMCAIVVLMF